MQQDFDKLGVFYLGRRYDLASRTITDEPILYDAKDLTTHAVCVGMTGSGKTGLAVAMLEEAILDGIPVLAVDPKGDLPNLLLAFPEIRAQDVRPWIDEAEARRKGRSPDEHARLVAEQWRNGLAEWGQGPDRIARFRTAANATVYTPGSTAGEPLSVLRTLNAPDKAVIDDPEALRERILAAVSGILALVGIDADPIRSREHILLATILGRAWREERDLDLAGLIRAIQDPGIERVGVFDLEAFYPAAERFELAMLLNNLVASPGFAAWLEGQPLEIPRLLFTSEGRAKLSIVSIAHLSERERMFVVTLLLSELIAWMRAQPGTGSLRALVYMDEVFGYFPPSANPPSKTPMLTLLKQARAYGIGIFLATQNPVDLDYKGLSNAGTWFIGRLQTERDKARVMDGLEGASAAASAHFDRAAMERTISGLGSRVFLMNNVHEDEPVVFHTRWVLSFLAGPMTREQIRRLVHGPLLTPPHATSANTSAARRTARETRPAAFESEPAAAVPDESPRERPVAEPGVEEVFLAPSDPRGRVRLYAPALLASVCLHYAKSSYDVDAWKKCVVMASLDEESVRAPWEHATLIAERIPPLDPKPHAGASFAEAPVAALRTSSYRRWRKHLASYAYKEFRLNLFRSRALKLASRPGESEAEFRARLREAARAERDRRLETLRAKYAGKIARLRDRMVAAEERISREVSQYETQKMQTAISLGSTLLGALFGRKLGSVSTVGRAATTARGAARVAREKADIARAKERYEDLQAKLAALEEEFAENLDEIREQYHPDSFAYDEVEIPPRKSDIEVERLVLAWMPKSVATDATQHIDQR